MSDSELLTFVVDIVVLVSAALVGGALAGRLGLPTSVGELIAGVLLGPSLLGWLWPSGFDALFPQSADHRGLLDVVAWIGVVMLVLIGGIETRLSILSGAAPAVVGAWAGGFLLPFGAGVLLGFWAPSALVPEGIDRGMFAAFVATALSISAIPVIVRILMDLNLYRTRVGMVVLAAAVVDDTIGWVMLSIVAGLVASDGAGWTAVRIMVLTGAFVAIAFTVGDRLVGRVLAWVRRTDGPHASAAAMLLLVLAGGAVTQAIGVHLVLGAFVTAVLIGRQGGLDPRAVGSIRTIGMGLFVPFFFAYSGFKVDLTTLRGEILAFAGVALLVASLGKIVGGGVGARLGGLPRWEAVTVGCGLNARGAMELVVAGIGVSIGVLNAPGYAIVVLIAIVTTVMAGPTMALAARRSEAVAVERERLAASA